MDEEKVVDIVLYGAVGPSFIVGSIRVSDEFNHVLLAGAKYELCPMYGASHRRGNPVELKRFMLSPIPVEEKTPRVPTEDILRHDYQVASISEDDSGRVHIVYAKKTKTTEQLECELDLAQHEIAELKKLNARQHDVVYKECLAEAKREIILAIGEL